MVGYSLSGYPMVGYSSWFTSQVGIPWWVNLSGCITQSLISQVYNSGLISQEGIPWVLFPQVGIPWVVFPQVCNSRV